MPSPEVLDFVALLAPLPGDNPCGVDFRLDPSPTSLYYAIKDARSRARNAERQALMSEEGAAGPVDWRPVLEHGKTVLTEKSKDLELVAYMIEALVRLHGFAGLRDGFRLARELVEQYWDSLYPQPDEEGIATRVAPLAGLNGEEAEGTLIEPIRKIDLTRGDSAGPYAYHHYQQASAIAQMVDEEARQRRIDQGAVSLEKFQRAVTETSTDFLTTLVEDIQQTQEEFERLGQALEERCGSSAPPTSNIRAALTACLDVVTSTARDRLAAGMPPEEVPPEERAEGQVSVPGVAVEGLGAMRTREDAFRALLKVAEYFRRTEPHTPVSYALEQAVRWGRMSLPELLTELIPDDSARVQLFKQVGIRPPEEASQG
jgi:type VI secretion system protein ImpA